MIDYEEFKNMMMTFHGNFCDEINTKVSGYSSIQIFDQEKSNNMKNMILKRSADNVMK